MFLSHTPELREFPQDRSFVRLAGSGVMAGKVATPEQLELLLSQALQETRPPG